MEFGLRQIGPFLTVVLLCSVGCDDKPKPAPTAPSASASTTVAPKASASVAAPTPKPLDVKMLQKALKCGKDGHGPCEVLDSFKDCKKWSPITQSGDGRWIGAGYLVKKSKFVDEYTLLRSRRVPVGDVGPGQLPVKIAISKIPDALGTEKTHAGKAVRKLARGDVTKRGNSAVRYLEELNEWSESFTMQADANQVFVAIAGGGFLCASSTGQQLMVVRLAGNREHPADGVYATMYPVKW